MSRRGRGGDRRSGQNGGVSLASLQAAISAGAFSWWRPTAGQAANTTPDRVNPGQGARAIDNNHAFTQASAGAAAVVNSSIINGRPAFDFSGQFYDSTIPAANWRVHDGSGWEIHCVWASKSTAGTGTLWSTRPAVVVTEIGAMHQVSTQVRVAVANGTSHIVETGNVGSLTANVPTYTTFGYDESKNPKAQFLQLLTQVFSSGSGDTPSSLDSPGTMRIGAAAVSGGAPANAYIADIIWVKGANARSLRPTIQAYFKAWYNL